MYLREIGRFKRLLSKT
ncbi:hypothetical protein H6G97_41535 [Nostoc flagelliforme FACHB-838]|uniref:Uncharacterized protein n=1 Tax=Nostoc flagelliforme FACHB-838 TaxID=2692904 RepID=A0ABR8E1K3_9NOSO|nr:hypothetical protein [Nostoc flagelliforme FACHB-838]